MNISIIVPIKEKDTVYISKKIQTLFPIDDDTEIILVDAGCSSEVTNYLKFMQDDKDNIHYLRLTDKECTIPFNQPIARNRGASIAKGKYLCFTDVDIYFSNDSLRELYQVIEETLYDSVIGCVQIITVAGLLRNHQGWRDTLTWFSLIRKDFFDRIGGFNELFAGNYGYDDIELVNRIYKYRSGIIKTYRAVAYMTRPDKGSFEKDADTSINEVLCNHLMNTYDYVKVPDSLMQYSGLLTYKDLQVLIHYALNAKVGTLEIGAFAGKSALAFLNNSSVPHCSIDSYYFDFNVYTAVRDDGSIIGDSKFINRAQAEELYRINVLDKFPNRVQLIKATSDDAITVENVCMLNKNIDVLFIDGDHTYEQAKKDFNNYAPLLSENGVIIFHDYKNEKGVKQFVDSLGIENLDTWGLCAIIKKEDLK